MSVNSAMSIERDSDASFPEYVDECIKSVTDKDLIFEEIMCKHS